MPTDTFMGGLMQGYGFGVQMGEVADNRERRKVVEGQQDEMYALNKELQTMNLENLKDEKVRSQMLRDINAVQYSIEKGTYDDTTIEAFNRVYSADINKGGPEGSKKRVINAVPSPDGKGFIPEIEVTTPDGKTYTAPATVPNRDPSDKDVMVIPFSDLFKDVEKRKALVNKLDALKISKGDNSPLTSAADEKRAEREHKYRMTERAAEPATVGKGAALVSRSGKELYRNPDGGDGAGGAGYSAQTARYNAMENSLARLFPGSSLDDATGKYIVPEGSQERFGHLNSIQQSIERQAPGKLAPGELANLVFKHSADFVSPIDAEKRAKHEAESKAPSAFNVLTSEKDAFGGLNKEQWASKRAQELVDESKAKVHNRVTRELGVGTGIGLQGAAPNVGAAPAGAQGAQTQPAKPQAGPSPEALARIQKTIQESVKAGKGNGVQLNNGTKWVLDSNGNPVQVK